MSLVGLESRLAMRLLSSVCSCLRNLSDEDGFTSVTVVSVFLFEIERKLKHIIIIFQANLLIISGDPTRDIKQCLVKIQLSAVSGTDHRSHPTFTQKIQVLAVIEILDSIV